MRFFLCLLFVLTIRAWALSDAELDAIGRRVWQNECGGTKEGLVSWNKGEAFASLGIGHFIWYPKGVRGPYQESFPELVRFLEANGRSVPAWVKGACPWPTREAFVAVGSSGRVGELRELLADTVRIQSRFLAQRMQRALPKLLDAASADRREVIRGRFEKLLSTAPGTFALIDYVNFKGEGTNPSERYRGEGWGMLQVLDGMEGDGARAFGASAARVLARRVANAPKDESRWLKGWTNRVSAYGK